MDTPKSLLQDLNYYNMNRYFAIILAVILIIFTTSVSAQKARQSKYIKQYDVLKYLPATSDNNPATFWKIITNSNEEFQKIIAKFNNPKGSAKEAKEKIDMAISRMNTIREMHQPTPTEESVNTGNRRMMFGDGDYYGMTFCISGEKEWNAYTTPDGYVTVNYGLIERLNKDPEMLCGVVANEVCHYMFKHALIHEYKSIKKRLSRLRAKPC